MSKKLTIPKNGLFSLPSSVRQTNNEEDKSTQVPENRDTEEFGNLENEEARHSGTSIIEKSTSILENSETLKSTNQDTEAARKTLPIIDGTSAPQNSSTSIPKELDNLSTQVLRNLSNEESSCHENELSENQDTSILKNSNIEVSGNLSTQVLKDSDTQEFGHYENELPENHDTEILKNSNIEVSNNLSSQVLENSSAEQLEVQDTTVAEVSSIKDSMDQDRWALPKPQKNNRTKDDKKPARKQASVHLTGAALKALHLYAYEEGLEKSEVVEKALRKFIPKRFFQ